MYHRTANLGPHSRDQCGRKFISQSSREAGARTPLAVPHRRFEACIKNVDGAMGTAIPEFLMCSLESHSCPAMVTVVSCLSCLHSLPDFTHHVRDVVGACTCLCHLCAEESKMRQIVAMLQLRKGQHRLRISRSCSTQAAQEKTYHGRRDLGQIRSL